jgi:NADH:ubiquinone oxidoreductase subunit E
LPILHTVQDTLGYIPPDAVPMISHALNRRWAPGNWNGMPMSASA